MNIVYIRNMVFFLSPYLFMALFDLSPKLPVKLKKLFFISFWIGYLVILLPTLYITFTKGFIIPNLAESKFLTIPTYLIIFYLFSILVCETTYFLSHGKDPWVRPICFGFLLSYVNSFYWEVPENIFWQIKWGYHPAIIFTVLGAFPYIWLNNRIGWKKTPQNILLVLFGLSTTTFGVLTMPSNIYTNVFGIWYFLFCHIVCLWVLLVIFIWKSPGGFWKWIKWRSCLVGAIICAYIWRVKVKITGEE